ncbi:MAG TPA: HEPN domain-containing protein [Rhodocyclaceae bacterium]|nr:HEPN domain-containing protein [Rhodocyclaceae bacterium]
MTPQREEVLRLLTLAQRDFRAMTVLAGDESISLSLVGFHGQQAIEKVFKALLTERGVMFRRTHDLLELAGLLADHGVQFPEAREALPVISRFAVDYRYDDPGEYPIAKLTRLNVVEAVLATGAAMLQSGG